MNDRLVPLAAASLLAGSLAAAEIPGDRWSDADPASLGFEPTLLEQGVIRFGEACGRDGHSQVLIVRHGRVAWRGPDVEVVHPVWSCTKSYLSTCLGLLWDDGRCSPETRAAEIMPELEAQYPEMTLGHLATFTAGFRSVEGPSLTPAEPLHPVGAAMHYGEQSDLLALLLTRIAGEPLRELFMRRVGRPIGIAEDHLVWKTQDLAGEPTAVHGGTGKPVAGVDTNAVAMARLGWLVCQGGVWNGQRLLSERYIEAATSVQVPADMPPHQSDGWYTVLPGHYGLNWWVSGGAANGGPMWPSLAPRTAAIQGNRNNICLVVPEWDLVITRLGTDPARDVRGYDAGFALIRQSLIEGGGIQAEP